MQHNTNDNKKNKIKSLLNVAGKPRKINKATIIQHVIHTMDSKSKIIVTLHACYHETQHTMNKY